MINYRLELIYYIKPVKYIVKYYSNENVNPSLLKSIYIKKKLQPIFHFKNLTCIMFLSAFVLWNVFILEYSELI